MPAMSTLTPTYLVYLEKEDISKAIYGRLSLLENPIALTVVMTQDA